MAMPTKRPSAAAAAPEVVAQEASYNDLEPAFGPAVEPVKEAEPTVQGEVVDALDSTAAPPVRRGPSGNPLWQPGVSGNPGGRRKTDPQIVQLLKDKSLAAAQTLVKLMEDPKVSPKVRCQAAEAILDRLYGKAVQPIDASIGGNGDPIIVMFQGVIAEWAK